MDLSTAACEHCGQNIEFPLDGAGTAVVCPHCGRETVLGGAEIAASPPGEITAAELSAQLGGKLPSRPASLLYHVGLLLVAGFMILLPLAYVAFVLSCGYFVYWYADHAKILFRSFTGGIYFMLLKVLLYLGPIIGGIVAVFFMLKPLLAGRRKAAKPVELIPGQHPRLYQFVAQISELMRAPMPGTIYLDCELNAGVAFKPGLFGMLSNDLVLVLGLPLVSGLDTRQFAAIVAHELGHCSQALAMRLGWVIEHVNRWFRRVVYERDTWDDALAEWSNEVQESHLAWLGTCAELAVWFSRQVLRLLMLAGSVVSCFLSRQMEFNADACAIAVTGARGLESALLRMREQELLKNVAYDGLALLWKEHHALPDNLAEFMQELEKRADADFQETAHRTLLNETAGPFATHPTVAQRIQRARQMADPGRFSLEKPAQYLFRDFSRFSRLVTGRHYLWNMGLVVTPPMLKPAAVFFEEGARSQARVIPLPSARLA